MSRWFDAFERRPMYYRLDEAHNVVPIPRGRDDVLLWAYTFEKSPRRVAETTIYRWWGVIWVSTVFLGLDHSFSMDPDAPPVVFETMAFPRLGQFHGVEWEREYTSDRYSTWDEAIAGHWFVVETVRQHRGTLREAWAFWTGPLRESYQQHLRDMGLPMQEIA